MKKQGKQGGSKGAGVAGTTPEMIMESMRCPVCTELLLSPIYQCERGHNICSVCIEEVHECPLCKGDYGDTRNYFAEELVNSMSFPCKYAEYGCPTTCPGSALKEHQENCEFQPYRCPELACQELMGQGQMAQHLERHGFNIMEGESHIATIDIQDKHFDTKTEYNPWRIRTFGNEFYTVASRQRDKNWYIWSWVLALPKNAKKYSCEIILSSSLKEVVYRGCVHSLRIPPEDIIKSANALVLTDQIVRAMRENGKITCRVRFIQGKNWDRDLKKDKKPFLHCKKDGKKNGVKAKGKFSKGILPSLPALKRSQSITTTFPAVKNISKASVSSSTPSTSRALPIIRGKLTPPPVSTVKKPSVTDAEQSLVLKMRESLKCPGCNESISPPIYVCNVGHSVCDACRIKRGCNCPLCRCPITGTRNFFAEELLYKTVQKCRFHSSGCDVCLPAVQIRLHEESCDFAPYECPFSTCRKVFDPNDLLEHMKTHDLLIVQDQLNMSIPFPKASSAPMCAIPSILVTHGIAFYPLVLREMNGAWAFWVASSDAVNFVYELRIKKQSKLMAFQGHVMSLRLNPNQILLRGEGLITTEKAIKNFKANEKFDFSLKIAPIKGFAKSGVTFLTPLCSGSTSGALNNNSATKTELFANQGTSKDKRPTDASDDDDESDDALLFAQMRRRNTYTELFVDEDDDEGLSVPGSSPGSRSSHSLKKTKSATSISSAEFRDEDRSFCDEERNAMEQLVPQTSQAVVSFNAASLSTANGDGESRPKSPSKSSTSNERLKGEKFEDGTKAVEQVTDAEKKRVPTKKKSALKLKQNSSQKDLINVKESPSAKKVEFNPNAEVFVPKSQDQQDKDNNNWVQDLDSDEYQSETSGKPEGIGDLELKASASASSLPSVLPALDKGLPNFSLLPNVQSTDSFKLRSKLEVFSRSCMELKNCGYRELMRSRMQQLSQSIFVAIEEEDDQEREMEEKEAVQWVEVTGNSEAGIEGSNVGPKVNISHDLIDLASENELPNKLEGNSMSMGEFEGPIEVIIRADDKVASISLSNIRKNLDSKLTVQGSSSNGNIISNFQMEIPIATADSEEEFVEEMDSACQVGSSLMRLVAEEKEALYGSQGLLNLDLSQSYETMSEGLTCTYHAVKNILSGMIPQKAEGQTPVDEEPELEEEEISAPAPVARLPENYEFN